MNQHTGKNSKLKTQNSKLRIAMLGTRGVPASYSGFETCVEQLGARLAQRGHAVTVYCRSHHIKYQGRRYKGMRLVKLPTIKNKYFDTLVHAFISSLHALFQPYDICLYFIAGNSPVTWIPRLAGKRTIINVDGLDWKREKWPPLAKKYIQLAERLSTILPDELVTDSKVVQRYYLDTYGVNAPYIAYGSEVEPMPPGETLAQWGLEPRKYILFVGRLVPENCAHHLVEAFGVLRDRKGMKCVIVGDAAYAEEYIASLKENAPEDVIFTGYLFGEGYRELSSNAYCFVETSGVGGTHPALLEAMGFGNCVVTHDTPENLETVGPAGFSYDGKAGAQSLSEVLQRLLDNPAMVAERRAMSQAHVKEHYSWEAITERYLALFYRVLRTRVSKRL
ncbi:MAG TPA: glycosyltransferase [Chloroflexia bacterium]|jgi:glycosyltransferase involved in cell wall biosynthesis